MARGRADGVISVLTIGAHSLTPNARAAREIMMAKLDKKKIKEQWDTLSKEEQDEILDSIGVKTGSTLDDLIKTVQTLQEEMTTLKKEKTEPTKKKGFFDSLV